MGRLTLANLIALGIVFVGIVSASICGFGLKIHVISSATEVAFAACGVSYILSAFGFRVIAIPALLAFRACEGLEDLFICVTQIIERDISNFTRLEIVGKLLPQCSQKGLLHTILCHLEPPWSFGSAHPKLRKACSSFQSSMRIT